MGPLFACFPMCTTLLALGVFGLLVVIAGAYHHPDPPAAVGEPPVPAHAPPVWVFVLSAQGKPGGQIRLSRHDLAAASWRLEIPAAVAGNLRAAGVIEPP